MEILYLRDGGRVIDTKPDGAQWGVSEVRDGVGVPPFGLLRRSMPLPNGPLDCLYVVGNRVEVRLPEEVKIGNNPA